MAIDRNKISKLAENHMASGRVDRAIEEFLKLVEDRPDDHNLLNRIGDAYLQAGKVPEAMEMFKKAGSGFERGGFNNKATAVLKKAHRIAAEDMDISERLAVLYRQTNMIKEAIQIHIEVADICTRKGLIKRALEEFAKVVELDPKNLKNKVKLADLYNKEGMKDRAAGIYLEVAESLAMDQMHAEAGQILERAKMMVSTPQVFLTQSRLAVIQKDLPGAAAHLREGLAANPRSSELLDALAEVELAATRSECDWEFDRRTEGVTLMIPEIQEMRGLARIVALKAKLAGVNTPEAKLLAQVRDELVPLRVSGRFESLYNRTANGWIVTLVNNEGITKSYNEPPRVDAAPQMASVRYTGPGRVRNACLCTPEGDEPLDPADIRFAIPPGDLRGVHLILAPVVR